jgi:hypothetical protein
MTGSSVRPPEASVLTGFRSRDPNVWLEAISWGVIVLCALQISTFSFGRDQSIYAVVGDGILNGRMPYRDLWDFKPPGIFLVHALGQALFGKHMFSARLLEVVALLGGVMCLRSISQQFFENRTVGLVGGAVGALIHAQLDFWHSGQPETFGVAFTWLALWLTLRESGKRVHWVALGVGLAFGAAALMKPPLGGGAIVAAAYLAQRARSQERGIRRALLLSGLVGAGAALPTLASLLWFWARGAYAEMYWTLGEFTPGYTALSWEGRRAADMLYHAIEEAFFKFSALSAAGVVAAVAMRPLFTRERELLFVLLGVIAIQLAGIAMQGKFFAYHYAATLSLIAAIAGIGLYKLWLRCLQGGVGGIIAFFAFIVVAVPMRYAVRDLPQFFWERCAIRLAADAGDLEARQLLRQDLDRDVDAVQRVTHVVEHARRNVGHPGTARHLGQKLRGLNQLLLGLTQLAVGDGELGPLPVERAEQSRVLEQCAEVLPELDEMRQILLFHGAELLGPGHEPGREQQAGPRSCEQQPVEHPEAERLAERMIGERATAREEAARGLGELTHQPRLHRDRCLQLPLSERREEHELARRGVVRVHRGHLEGQVIDHGRDPLLEQGTPARSTEIAGERLENVQPDLGATPLLTQLEDLALTPEQEHRLAAQHVIGAGHLESQSARTSSE